MINLWEAWARTDPLDPSSRLAIVAVAQAPSSGKATIFWQATKFSHYRIQRCTDLRASAWETVAADIQALATGVMSWEDPDSASHPNASYRVVLRLP